MKQREPIMQQPEPVYDLVVACWVPGVSCLDCGGRSNRQDDTENDMKGKYRRLHSASAIYTANLRYLLSVVLIVVRPPPRHSQRTERYCT